MGKGAEFSEKPETAARLSPTTLGSLSVAVALSSWVLGLVLLFVVPILSPLLPLSGAVLGSLGIHRAIRYGRRAQAIVPILGVILSGPPLLFHVPFWPSAVAHEFELWRVRDVLCEEDVPPAATPIACVGHIENPYNGNQCGYTMRVFLDTRQPAVQLAKFYNLQALEDYRENPVAVGERDPFYVPRIRADWDIVARDKNTRIVSILVVGDDGTDWRCN